MKYLYVISPTTNEIFPFLIKEDQTFQPIINHLEGKNLSKLIYYDGQETITLYPEELITPYLRKRESQILFLAYPRDTLVDLPLVEAPLDKILILFYFEKNIYPYLAQPEDRLNEITSHLDVLYQKNFIVTQYQGGVKSGLTNKIITEILPPREDHVLLVLQDYSNLIELSKRFPGLVYDILLKLEVEDIRNACRSSTELARYCDDPYLWQLLVERDFGRTLEPPGEEWRKFYYALKTYNPKELLIIGAQRGDLAIVDYAISQGAFDYPKAMEEAAAHGQIEIVKFMLDKGADNFNETMGAAALHGHLNIVKLMLNPYKLFSNDNFPGPKIGVSELPPEINPDGVTFIVLIGANDYEFGLANAAQGGHIEIVNLLLPLAEGSYEDHLESALIYAAYGGHKDLVKLFLERGAGDNGYSIMWAAGQSEGKPEDVVLDIIELLGTSRILDPDFINQAIDFAAESGYINVINGLISLLIKYNTQPNYIAIISAAARAGHKVIVTSFLELSAVKKILDDDPSEYLELLTSAADGRNKEIFNYIADLYDKALEISPVLQISIADDVIQSAISSGVGPMVNEIIQFWVQDRDRSYYDDLVDKALEKIDQKSGKDLISNIKHIINWAIERGASNFNFNMKLATQRGYIEIVEMMLSNGAYNFTEVLIEAAKYGHLEIVELMLSKQIDIHPSAIENSIMLGHNEIVKSLWDRFPKLQQDIFFENYLNTAASVGNIEIVIIMLKYAEDFYKTNEIMEIYNNTLINAASNGSLEIVEIMLEKLKGRRINRRDAIINALENNHWLVTETLL